MTRTGTRIGDGQAPGGDTPGRTLWFTLALLSAAQFMLVVDVTVVNVALPSIGRDLGLDRAQLTWIVTAYTLLFGSLLVLGGRLADSFGRRRMFLAGVGLFVLASLGSGIAPSGEILVACRGLQGIAAAVLSPAALSLVTTTFDGPARNKALGIWAALGGAGAVAGVILGGVLTSGPGWQWIFFVNVPVGTIVAVGIARLVAPSATKPAATGLDVLGAGALAIGVGSLLWAVIDAGSVGWTAGATLGRIGLAALFLTLFAWRESSTAEPLVRLRMLADRRFAGAVALMLTSSAVLGGAIFLATLYLQVYAGLPAIETGLLFIPMGLALIGGAQWAARFAGHHGQRGSATVGFIAAAVGVLYLSRLPAPGLPVAPGMAVTAFGIVAVMVSATMAAFSTVAPEEAGRASGFVNTAHEVGLALGAAIASTVGGPALVAGHGVGAPAFATAFLAGLPIAVAGAVVAGAFMPAIGAPSGRRAFAH